MHRDYKTVCDYVYNLINTSVKQEDEELFLKSSNAYNKLVEILRNLS